MLLLTGDMVKQAEGTAQRLAEVANALAARGDLAAAEIVAGGTLTIGCLLSALAPAEAAPTPKLESVP